MVETKIGSVIILDREMTKVEGLKAGKAGVKGRI